MRLFQASEDAEIISALEDVQLWSILESKGGLDATLTDDVLSHGQRQLFCFARATLQQGKILILDEPSSQ
jgi:ATP-binding cassette subfamily C (CFTR/MRP) protein 1